MSAPFVGRHRELGTLARLVQRALRESSPSAGLVIGEPGSGKTRLLAEAARVAGPPRRVRLVGFEPMQQVPLGAAADLLHLLAKTLVDGTALERLVFGNVDDEAIDPLRIFEAAHRALAASGPLLLAIDDLQWVDERSVALVHYLLRSASSARQPLVVLAVARPSPVTAAFRAGLVADVESEHRALIDLQPLPLVEGLSLVRSIDADLDERTATDLWRRASGSPFWLEALARSRALDDPAGLIRERMQDLSPDAGLLISALAIAARPVTEHDLVQVEDWDAARVRGAARELVARGLAVEAAGTISPAHDLIREATAAGLPPAVRRGLHARLADWIEAAAGDDLSTLREALEHRLAAGQPTVELVVRLISSPRRRLMNGDDLRLLASISDELEPGSVARITIDQALGELGAVIGELDLALGRWTRVAAETADASDARDAEIEAARAAYLVGRSAEAHEHLDRARALSTADLEAIVRLEALQADVELWLDHETAAGGRTAEHAVAAAEEMASTSGGLDALPVSARRAYLAAVVAAIDGAMQEDRDDDIIGLAERCLRIAKGLDDESRIDAEMRVGQAFRTVSRPREGEAQGRQAWEASKRLILPLLTVEAGQRLARVLLELGRLAEAHAVAVETRDLEMRLTNAPKEWGGGVSIRHVIELSFADSAAALRALRRDAAEEPDPHYSQDLHLEIAVWQARVSGAKAASDVEAELAAAHADAAIARCPRHSNNLALYTAELLARIGRIGEARRALAEWDRRPGTGRISRDLWRMGAAAAIAAAEGDVEAASSTLGTYEQALEQAGLNLELIWARIDLGRCLAKVDRSRAVAAFVAAAELAEACSARSEVRLASQALRQLGVRAWRRGPAAIGAGVDALSEREREVANLIAAGNSNREIADRLVLSPKTVERHLTNILAKLDLRNRTELAARILSSSVRGSPDD
jgi:DNA-binding CsgD family transcriptional regulator/tetratricopeptide (TPR) repeat protein